MEINTKRLDKNVSNMKLMWWVFFLFPFMLSAQENGATLDSGIYFRTGLNWQQILSKAVAERKYIFVDCYTTWCAPCKEMEKEVYPLEKVGTLFNQKFICIKMQMDTSKNDDESIKAQYTDANYLQTHYKIAGYPSFLFFTSDGRLLNRDLGKKNPEEFIRMAEQTIDPDRNYYEVLNRFSLGKTNVNQAAWLFSQAQLLGDTTASRKIASFYLAHLTKDSVFTKSNIDFMSKSLQDSRDLSFGIFFRNTKKIDSIMGDDVFAEQVIHHVIFMQIVKPAFDSADHKKSTPDWGFLKARIRKKYNNYYADRVIISARSSWAGSHHDDPGYCKYLTLFEDAYGSKTNCGFWEYFRLNNSAWSIFSYSKSPEELKSALSWSGRAVLMFPTPVGMDTYANILYKMGRKDEALFWETNASKLDTSDKDIQSSLSKMKMGLPTWQ